MDIKATYKIPTSEKECPKKAELVDQLLTEPYLETDRREVDNDPDVFSKDKKTKKKIKKKRIQKK